MAWAAAVLAGALLFGNPTTSRWAIGGLIGGVAFYYATRPSMGEMDQKQVTSQQKKRKRRDAKSRSVPSGEAVRVVAVESEARRPGTSLSISLQNLTHTSPPAPFFLEALCSASDLWHPSPRRSVC